MKIRIVALVVLMSVLIAVFAGCGAAANSVAGLWYEETGFGGTIEFKSGGVVTISALGMSYDGTYTFDAAKGAGTATFDGSDSEFMVKDGKLISEGLTYTREVVEQKLDDALEDLGNTLDGLVD